MYRPYSAIGGPVELELLWQIFELKGLNSDLRRGLRRNSSASLSNLSLASTVLSAYRRYETRMSHSACFRSSSPRTRKVIQPESGTQWCVSASPSSKSASRTIGETECQPLRRRGHARFLQTECPTSKTMRVNRYFRPQDYFLFQFFKDVIPNSTNS